MRLLLAFLAAIALSAAQATTTVTTPHVRADLLAHAPGGVGPGQTVWLGLRLVHTEGWHTYWKNPGDSGLPTTFEWLGPHAHAIGDIDWPAPQTLPFGPLLNYGYDGTVLLPATLHISENAHPDAPIEVGLRADWLVCKESCIPERADFTLTLRPGPPLTRHQADFEATLNKRPASLPELHATVHASDKHLELEVTGLPAALHETRLQLLPEVEGLIDHAAKQDAHWVGGRWMTRVALAPQPSSRPDVLPAVLLGETGAWRIEANMSGWSGNTPSADFPPAPVDRLASSATSNNAPIILPSFGMALLLATLGGMLLNLMPCVFPILSLKVLSFARHAGERRPLAIGGLAYAAGVMLSFLALAAGLLALRAGGEQLGWGFQLQEPSFVAALALLFMIIGLNLAGVFEFRHLLPGSVGGWQLKHPAGDAFLTGILAVAVASPCTAPFMGVALGFALTLPAAQTLLIFAALGLGLALPYLAASLLPGIARALPKPGPWMARLRTLMAFPMFATVLWLLWVFGLQVGVAGLIALLALMLALGFVAWAWSQSGRSRWWLGIPALAIAALTTGAALPVIQHGSQPGTLDTHATVNTWQAWSAERVALLRAAGQPVFVDFTAAWCVTCQVNKHATLSDTAVLDDFQRAGVQLLRADWTARDPAISAELDRLGRAGVPVYALYPADPQRPPMLLSELLSTTEIRNALLTLN